MGEAEASQLEHITEMPQGCGYRLKGNPIPVKIEQVGGQYVAEACLDVMLATNAWGSTPEEAKGDLAEYLAAELTRLKNAKQQFLNEFEASAQARLKQFLVEDVEYEETPETMEHPEDEVPPPYGKDSAESPLDKAPVLVPVDASMLPYFASLAETMRMQREKGWMYNPLNREKEPPKIIIASR